MQLAPFELCRLVFVLIQSHAVLDDRRNITDLKGHGGSLKAQIYMADN